MMRQENKTVAEKATEKRGASYVVKVTGVSEAMLEMLDARVRQQQATGRAGYIRELIRRDALMASGGTGERGTRRHKARRRSSGTETALEQQRLAEYHSLVDMELDGRLSPGDQARLRDIEGALDRAEAKSLETQAMFARLEETTSKLDALLAAVRALPQAEA